MDKPLYRFGEFELDPGERRLLANGHPVTLAPKTFDTLVLLVERAGRVFSKDELMQALWPRGFVDESNLTKNIWLIRRTLDEAGHATCWLETVPKVGYRFVAPVQRYERATVGSATLAQIGSRSEALSIPAASTIATDEPTADAGLAPETRKGFTEIAPVGQETPTSAPGLTLPPDSPRLRFTRISRIVIVIAIGALGVVAVRQYRVREPLVPSRTELPADSGVAIVAFNNLSQNSKDAWLGPALGEMLATEIATSDRLHVVPDELVRSARSGLAAPLAGGYAAQSLATLRKRLGAEYVLSGSYLVSGVGEESQLRLDLALQDARSGGAIATLTRSGTVADLPELVLASGALLRSKLGLPSANSAELRAVAAAQPPTSAIARRIGFALDALQRHDPARARDELLDAIAQAPGFAPAYSYLAQAWSALGYNAKALAAAQQAAAHAEGLPAEQRLQIVVQVAIAQHEWSKAIETIRELVKLRPQNPEYRFQLIATLISAGKVQLAQSETSALLKLPGLSADDPRLDLVQAQVAAALQDSKRQAVFAETALHHANQRDEVGLAAEAGVTLGVALADLGDNVGAEKALKQARVDYSRVGNPHGEAWTDQNLANVYTNTDVARAREVYQRALSSYVAIGDRSGEAAIYSDLGILLWSAGDRDGTETAVRKSLAIRRETADLAGQAWNLAALGSIELDEAATDEVASDYREAIALDERAGERKHRAYTLTQYSDMQRLRGDLVAAAATCAQALAAYRDIGEIGNILGAQFQCALIALDRGDVSAASASAQQVLVHAESSNNVLMYNAGLMQAQIAMARGDWIKATALLKRAIETATQGELVTGEAIAQSQLAICLARLGRTAERDRAAARASELRSRVTERQEVFAVDIALAEIHGETGHRDSAIAALRTLIDDADKRNWRAWSLEGRLELVRLLEAGHDPSANAQHDALLADASKLGFNWIVQRLRKPVAR